MTVDGAVITDPARDVTGEEAIALDGEAVRAPGARVVFAVHKPAGVVSTAPASRPSGPARSGAGWQAAPPPTRR